MDWVIMLYCRWREFPDVYSGYGTMCGCGTFYLASLRGNVNDHTHGLGTGEGTIRYLAKIGK